MPKLTRPSVFVSYSHRDDEAIEELQPYLETLTRKHLVEVWTDQNLRGGERWRDEINAVLDAASVAVLLISQRFLASAFVYEEELPRILERQANGSLTVLPVYLSPSTVTADAIVFQDAGKHERRILLSDFQGFGTPDETLSEMEPPKRQRTFVKLHARIEELANVREVELKRKERQPRAPAPPARRAHKEEEAVRPGTRRLWPDGRVPYVMSATLTGFNAAIVRQAIAHFEDKTVLRFTELTEQAPAAKGNCITFVKGDGDSSSVGLIAGQQRVTVSGKSLGDAIHSIGHAIGLWHESSRVDRDQYVTVVWENIHPAALHNFTKVSTGDEHIRPYDYGSIMHYARHAFSSNGGPTIIPKKDVHIGQRVALSADDVRLINGLYRARSA